MWRRFYRNPKVYDYLWFDKLESTFILSLDEELLRSRCGGRTYLMRMKPLLDPKHFMSVMVLIIKVEANNSHALPSSVAADQDDY